MMLFLVVLLLLKSSVVKPQGQVSGNAMDLASMNMNMMNRKCPLQTCQSVCLQKQQSGCYICSPSCRSGNNLGLPEPGLPIQVPPISPGQGFYSGCVGDNTWMNCPVTCHRKFDQNGCFQCQCENPSITKTVSAPDFYQTSTSKSKATHYPGTKAPTSEKNILKGLINSVVMETTSISPTAATLTTTTNLYSTEMKTKPSTISVSEPRRVSTEQLVKLYPYDTDHNETFSEKEAETIPVTTNTQYDEKSATSGINLPSNGEQKNRDGFTVNKLSFLFLGLIFVLVVLSFGFFHIWRKAERKLRKNKDELYFVHKTYRQDSTARLSRNEMSDQEYVDVTPRRPRPPPRHLHDGNQLPPIRTLSQTSDTLPTDKLSEGADVKHDYLELI